jgi:predicted nucleic acid-binding protein
MSGKAFVDSNILIYAHDRDTGEKNRTAREIIATLWHERRGVLSTQVLQEFSVNVRKKATHPVSREELKQTLEDLMSWETIVNSPRAVLRALEIEEGYQLSFWDAMIVQAAISAECAIIYSEDLSHGQEYEGVLVVNPFR